MKKDCKKATLLKIFKIGLPVFVQSLGTSIASRNNTNQSDKKAQSTPKKRLAIGESIITLLVKIMHKYQNKYQNTRSSESESNDLSTSPTTSASSPITIIRPSQVPVFEFKAIEDSRIGDEYYFISNLLNKAAILSLNCKECIEEALNRINIKPIVAESDEEEENK